MELKMTLRLKSFGDEEIEQPSTSNTRLDVILPISVWVKEERADRAALGEGQTEEKEQKHKS